ncbi:hypothetical protein ABPG72_003994 [Tetrahymena utriculariae]
MSLIFKKKTTKNASSLFKFEKEVEWVILVNGKSYYTIQFVFSDINNQKILKLNELTLLKANIKKDNLDHTFQIENIDLTIKYNKDQKQFQLLAYGNDIQEYSEENIKKQSYLKSATYSYSTGNQYQQPPIQNQYNSAQLGRSQTYNQAQHPQSVYQQNQHQAFQPNSQQVSPQQQMLPLEKQIEITENLVQMFDDVIDSCKLNKDVIDSEDLRELKKSIQIYYNSLTQFLNMNVSESMMDKLLKIIERINNSLRYYEKILTREIVIDNIDFGASRAQFNKQNNVIVPPVNQPQNKQNQPQNKQNQPQNKSNNNNNDNLLLEHFSDSSNSDEDHQVPQQINHSYPQQPQSQVLFYQNKQIQKQAQQQQEVQSDALQQSYQQPNKVLIPSLPPQQIKQYPQVKLNEQLSPQPLNNSNQISKNNIQGQKQDVDDENMCIICMNEESTYTLIPCGHKKYCGACAEEMVKQKQCAFCRKPCQQSLRIFD